MYAQLWKLPFILFIVLISTGRAGAALSDLITPHCVWGSLTSGRSCGWQDSPNPHPPTGPFFCGTGSSQSSSVPADNTNKQRKQWRSGENSRRSDLHDLSLFYKHKAKWRASERGSWTCICSRMMAFFSLLWAAIKPQHLESTSETSTFLQSLHAICSLQLYAPV